MPRGAQHLSRNNPVIFRATHPRVDESSEEITQRKEKAVPYVNIKLTPPGVSPEQKAQVIAGVTKVLQDVLGKKPELTFVVIDEVQPEDWGIGGESVAQRMEKL